MEAIGFDRAHLHMVLVIPPKYSIAEGMGKLKSQSASQLREEFPWLEKVYWKESIVWSPGYFVSSVGVDAETIKRYVEHQGPRIQVNCGCSGNSKNPGHARRNLLFSLVFICIVLSFKSTYNLLKIKLFR